MVQELFSMPTFKDRAIVFIRDLRAFGSDPKAQTRLLSTNSEFYIGLPYFDSDTTKKILSIPMGSGTVQDELERIKRRKAERGEGDEICASHDLAPIFAMALNLEWQAIKDDGNNLAPRC
jgi:hypothetical protein